MSTIVFTEDDLKPSRLFENTRDSIDTHNFICQHVRETKPNFWGRRKLRRAMKHISDRYFNKR
jgi:hypothetical protein